MDMCSIQGLHPYRYATLLLLTLVMSQPRSLLDTTQGELIKGSVAS